MTDLEVAKEIGQMLKSINTTYFGSVDVAALGGSTYVVVQESDTTTIAGKDDVFPDNGSTTTSDSLLNKLFAKQLEDNTTSFITKTIDASTVDSEFVYVKKNGQLSKVPLNMAADAASDDVTLTGAWDTDILNMIGSSVENRVEDINVYNLMGDDDEKAVMNALYVLYDLMSDDNWKQYSIDPSDAKTTLNLQTAEIGTDMKYITTNLSVTANNETTEVLSYVLGDSWEETLASLAASPSFIPFFVRRLAYLYIRLFSFYISLRVLKNVTDAVSSDSTSGADDKAAALPNAIFKLLDYDLNVLRVDAMSALATGINTRKERYNTYSTEINNLNDKYVKTREFVKKNSERNDSERVYEAKSRTLLFVGLAVFLVAFAVAAYSMLAPMEFKQKMMWSGGAIAFAVIMGVILLVLFTNQVVEGFAVNSVYATKTLDTLATNLGVTAIIGDLNSAILELARDYLRQVTTILQNVESYRVFGNTTYTMAKEYRYYTDHNKQLRNAGEKFRGLHRASDLYQKRYAATMYLFIVLAIIVSIMIMAYIAAGEKMPIMQPVVLWVGGILLAIVFISFIIEVSGYVRTDGDKKYWGKPDTNKL